MKRIRTWLQRHAQNCVASLGTMSRQPLASALTIVVIGIALALPAALNVLVQNGRAIAGGWDAIRDFSVYLTPGTPLDRAHSLRTNLDDRAIVASARLIPADEALKTFAENREFGDLLATLDRNPLPHAIVIRPAESTSAAQLAELEAELTDRSDVDLVQLDTEWVRRLNAMLDLARRIVWLAAVLLVAAVVVIVGNTIRLDIQNRRAEIEVAKLLGASDGFVRRPFLYTGFWYGLLGGVFAWLLLGIGLWLLSGPIERLTALYGGASRPLGTGAGTALAMLGGGLLAGLLGAWTAVARHLAAIQPRV